MMFSEADLIQYLQTALWSTTGDDDDPLDAQYATSDFADETRKQMSSDLESFLESAGEMVLEHDDSSRGRQLVRRRGAGDTGADDENVTALHDPYPLS